MVSYDRNKLNCFGVATAEFKTSQDEADVQYGGYSKR